MINEQIRRYVATERARGVGDAAIRSALLEKGWKEEEVNDAFLGEAPAANIPGTFALSHLFEGRLDNHNFLILVVLGFAANLLLELLGMNLISIIIGILLIPIGIGTGVRRWHDVGQSGWWVLTFLIPVVSIFVVLYLCFKKGDPAANQYGPVPDPKRPFLEAALNRAF